MALRFFFFIEPRRTLPDPDPERVCVCECVCVCVAYTPSTHTFMTSWRHNPPLQNPFFYREASVRFGYGSGVERFERFRFLVFCFYVPLRQRFFLLFQYNLTGKDGSGSGFGSWKMVPAVAVPLLVSGKNGSGGSGSRFRFGS